MTFLYFLLSYGNDDAFLEIFIQQLLSIDYYSMDLYMILVLGKRPPKTGIHKMCVAGGWCVP